MHCRVHVFLSILFCFEKYAENYEIRIDIFCINPNKYCTFVPVLCLND